MSGLMKTPPEFADGYTPIDIVIAKWQAWCGATRWTDALGRFAVLGGKVKWWCGFPRSASAIPLCFGLYTPDGREIPGRSRLKDIRYAIALLERERDC